MSEHSPRDPLEESLITALVDQEAFQLLVDAGELSIDQFLNEGLLREIPIISTAAALYRAGVGIRNYMFLRKLGKFFTHLADLSQNERRSFAQSLEDDAKARQRVGEALVIFIDRFDDLQKPQLLAKAFTAYVRERIDFLNFRRLASAIDRAFVADLAHLSGVTRDQPLDSTISWGLAACGLIQLFAAMPVAGPGSFSRWELTPLGELFIEVVLDAPTS